jgi:hypothetical protein
MNNSNRKIIQDLVKKRGYKKIIKYDNKIFWHEDLVREALNLVEKKKK